MKKYFEQYKTILKLILSFLGGLLLIFTGLTVLTFLAQPSKAQVADAFSNSNSLSVNSHLLRQHKNITDDLLPNFKSSNFSPSEPTSELSQPAIPDWVRPLLGQVNASNNDVIFTVKVNPNPIPPEGNNFVFLGTEITYIIEITNTSGNDLTNVTLFNLLPPNTFATGSGITCTDSCTQDPNNTAPTSLTWSLGNILKNGGNKSVSFTGTIVCQADDATVTNEAILAFDQDGSPNALNEITDITAKVQFSPDGNPQLSTESPTWCSSENLALDMDWGDFDRDGDLDLALAASVDGVKVYQNENGQLVPFSSGPVSRFAAGAFWADINTDGELELVVLGHDEVQGGTIGGKGFNYIYEPTPGLLTQIDDFETDRALYRAIFGKFNNDNHLDLISIRFFELEAGDNEACQIELFYNSGIGNDRYGNNRKCILSDSTWIKSITAADFDNDGRLDFAVGGGDTQLDTDANNKVFTNMNNGNFSSSVFETFYPAYALDSGDFDRDGYLDLAASFSARAETRVHQNDQGDILTSTNIITENVEFTVRGLGWGDLNGNGKLELAVGTEPPKIYKIDNNDLDQVAIVPSGIFSDFTLWRARAIDIDNDGDNDVSFTNSAQLGNYSGGGPTLLLTNFAPPLSSTLTNIQAPIASNSTPAQSVAWGDADNDGDLDLLFGAADPSIGVPGLKSKLYYNVNGNFVGSNIATFGFAGPHQAVFGNVLSNDNVLDVVMVTPNSLNIYASNDPATAIASLTLPATGNTVALGDADFDDNTGDLELLVATANGPILYSVEEVEETTTLSVTNIWNAAIPSNAQTVAWADFDGDHDLDFAVGSGDQPTHLYQNNGNRTFTSIWNDQKNNDTRSVAWGDYDQDGDPDLAVGNHGGRVFIYENLVINTGTTTATTLNESEIWSTTADMNTTSLAWGDWNNDGDLDLAIGNDEGTVDRVYDNTTPPSGEAQFAWLWTSDESLNTTGVAWGDRDSDGDLDLAISQDGNANNGYYENNYVLPAHIEGNRAMPLPNNPTYVSVDKPGDSGADYFYGSAELLSGAASPVIAINYKLFDPDGSRQSGTNNKGDPIYSSKFEYSLDGGYSWKPATQCVPNDCPSNDPLETETRRLGKSATFLWNAQKDEAISDNARFRISVVFQDDAGPVQRASTQAVSPPFRVRGLSCEWPDGLSITAEQEDNELTYRFTAGLENGSGAIDFVWDFGNTMTATGQVVQYEYNSANLYTIVVTATVPPCPVSAPVVTDTIDLLVGLTFTPTDRLYLPLLQKPEGESSETTGGEILTLSLNPQVPRQVTQLGGETQIQANTTRLSWQANPPEDNILGYRIYRANVGQSTFRRLAELPTNVTTYTDTTAQCRQMYLVTAYNTQGESLPSTSSYFSPPCP